jgi:large conductance mechanosensitive channel
VDFSRWAITLKDASVDATGAAVPAVVLGIGGFLNTVVQFLIVAAAVFLVVKLVNRMHRKEAAAPAPPAEPGEEILLLREIRDALKR